MILTEKLESINRQLVDLFGVDTISGSPIWRVVWSEDQFEKRHGTYDDYTSGGIYLRTVTEVREVPKYRQWIREKYVLERLTVVPVINQDELPGTKLTYEPIYVFEDKNGNYLPPKLEAAKFIIDTMYAAMGKTSMAKYVDEEIKNPAEAREARISKLEEELFGNETQVGDALAYREAIVNPYQKENES